MRVYLLQRARTVRALRFSVPLSFLFSGCVCTSQACKKDDTTAPLLFFFCPARYAATSRAITHKGAKRDGSPRFLRRFCSFLSLFLSSLAVWLAPDFLFSSFNQHTRFLSCRHAEDHMSRNVIRTRAHSRRSETRLHAMPRDTREILSRRRVASPRRIFATRIRIARGKTVRARKRVTRCRQRGQLGGRHRLSALLHFRSATSVSRSSRESSFIA